MEVDYVFKKLKEQEAHAAINPMSEHEAHHHKKACSCCTAHQKEDWFLCQKNITELNREERQRVETEQTQASYLNNMPVSFVTLQLLLDENEKPCDFEFFYVNNAYAKLAGTTPEALTGKKHSELYSSTEHRWLEWLYKTACLGMPQTINRHDPDTGNYVMITAFQVKYGQCGCIIQDLTEKHILEQKLAQSQKRLQYVLASMTNGEFRYDLKTECFFLEGPHNEEKVVKKIPADQIADKLEEYQLLAPGFKTLVEDSIAAICRDKKELSFELRARNYAEKPFQWYRITMLYYNDLQSGREEILGYIQNIERSKAQHELLKQRAMLDPLTKIMNVETGRTAAIEKITKQNGDYYNAMLILDIDDFKTINDTKGHQAGDQLLTQFAAALQHTFRSNDVIYRLGGDEFVVFMEKLYELDNGIAAIMERFYKNMAAIHMDGLKITSSIGIYAAKEKQDFQHYYKQADKALYQTKKAGKNHYTLYVDDNRQSVINTEQADWKN